MPFRVCSSNKEPFYKPDTGQNTECNLAYTPPISHRQSKKGPGRYLNKTGHTIRPHRGSLRLPEFAFCSDKHFFSPGKQKTSQQHLKSFSFLYFFSRRATFCAPLAVESDEDCRYYKFDMKWQTGRWLPEPVDFQLRSCCILMMISRTSFSLFRDGEGFFCSPVIIVSIYRGPMSGGTENCTRKLIPGAFKLWFRVGRVIVFGFVHVVQNFVLL